MPAHDSDTTTRSGVISGSKIVAALQSLHDTASPRISAVRSWTIGVIRRSFIYRWFTTPPEPEVIVIDLRETATIGPVLFLLERILAVLRPWFDASHLGRGIDRLSVLVSRSIDTRLGQTIVALFEPPEPPESPQQTDHENQHESEREC